MYWSVAMTKANSENTALANLVNQGYTVWLPKYTQKIGTKTRVKPLFPRYIFVLIDDAFHSISSTRGVSRLIMNEDKPAVVPDDIINSLRSREDSKGLISLPELGKFKKGDNLCLADGPFSGYNVLYDGMSDTDRSRVLIDLLGRKVIIEVNDGSLSAVAS